MDEKKYKVLIDVSRDKQQAYLTLIEDPDGISINKEVLLQEIAKHNIVYGIKFEVIDNICKDLKKVKGVLIAEGKKPINGEDGKVIFAIDIEKNATPKILEDGSVDYKNLDLFKNIKKGQIIARKINPTAGQPGI
ncbi:MAG: uncharacterized protein PWP18_492, partial [Thermoanaerobacter sp.]|nr:uncharacterized protein [Thermoanaerobacter sp.]